MKLTAQCPRCPGPLVGGEGAWSCLVHGATVPLLRAHEVGYDAFAEHLMRSRPLPSWLPWPMPPGWQVTDFGVVVGEDGAAPRAAFVTSSGLSTVDGPVEITVLTEEPGVGLGARCAGVPYTDPGEDTLAQPPDAKVRVDDTSVAVWAVSTSEGDGQFDRSVFAGEAQGRWLWLVLRPASVALMLPELTALQDVSGLGPELVALPFGEMPRAW